MHYSQVGLIHRFELLASPKMNKKMCINIFRFFLEDLELFECRQDNSYMTADRSFVRSLTRNNVGYK